MSMSYLGPGVTAVYQSLCCFLVCNEHMRVGRTEFPFGGLVPVQQVEEPQCRNCEDRHPHTRLT